MTDRFYSASNMFVAVDKGWIAPGDRIGCEHCSWEGKTNHFPAHLLTCDCVNMEHGHGRYDHRLPTDDVQAKPQLGLTLRDRIAAVIADCRVFDEQTHMTNVEIADAVIAELSTSSLIPWALAADWIEKWVAAHQWGDRKDARSELQHVAQEFRAIADGLYEE